MKRRRQLEARGALEWIEEAAHLLRTLPLTGLAAYYIGAFPFVLGLLFYWADMSRSPFARQHVVEAALGVTCLFLWMKTWQAIFCLQLRAVVSAGPVKPMTLRRVMAIFAGQATLQPMGLILIPLSAILLLPFTRVFGFHQGVTALAEPGTAVDQSLFARSIRSSRFWRGQYLLILFMLGVFAGVVFLNWTVVCLMLPGLIKTLFGIETTFSRSPFAMLNTTFFAAMAGLTYLSVDPLVKAFHVLRCYRVEAQTTGEDLKSGLRHAVSNAQRVTLVLVFALASFTGSSAKAAEVESALPLGSGPVVESGSIPSQQLDKAIEEVISQRKYTWRMPRDKVMPEETAEEGHLARFFAKVTDMLGKWVRSAFDWLGEIIKKLWDRPSKEPVSRSAPGNWGPGLASGARLVLYALIILAVVALSYLAIRAWRNRRQGPEIVDATPLQVVPDLEDENVGAEQLPEDEWARLGHELLARGDFRLAMRAYYLSSLAHLAERRLITLAKFKSNRDYERELERRSHALAELPSLFTENVSTFDQVWYGLHFVDAGTVNRFASNVEQIRALA